MTSRMELSGWRRYGRALVFASVGAALVVSPLRAQDQRGFLGVQLWCSTSCEMQESNGQVIWVFETPPIVTRVQPSSPAQRGGLQPGDTVLAIDGIDLTTDEGGRRMGGLRVGVPVSIRVRRAGGERELRIVPEARPELYADADLPGGAPALADDWDSLKVQLRSLNREQRDLELALRRADQLWGRNGWVATDSQRQVVLKMRQQMDSIWQELVRSQRRVADSLALRTLTVTPLAMGGDSTLCPLAAPVPSVTPRPPDAPQSSGAPRPLAVTVWTSYLNAVAGARFETLNPDLGSYFGTAKGLLVLQVVEGTPADVAGLRPGDVVVEANGREIANVGDLREALAGMGGKEIQVVRRGRSLPLQIRPR